MRLCYDKERREYFLDDYSFMEHQRSKIATNNGLRWNPVLKRWYTSDKTSALRLARYADPQTQALLMSIHPDAQPANLLLYFDGKQFILDAPADSPLPNRHGFLWHGRNRKWFTRDSYFAAQLSKFADARCRIEIERQEARRQQLCGMSAASDSDMYIPMPEGIQLYPFQRASVAFACELGNSLNGDDMGLGKTVQAAALINCKPHLRRVLIIVPANVKLQWQRQLNRLLVDKKLHIGIAGPSYWPKFNPLLEHGVVVLINFEILHKHAETIRQWTHDLLVVDEAHRAKNAKTRTAVYINGGTHEGKKVEPIEFTESLWMSGTFTTNGRPLEMFPALKRTAPHHWPTLTWFKRRYCQGDDKGIALEDEFNARVSSLMVRRLKLQVLADLPEKTVEELPIPADAAVVQAETLAEAEQLAKEQAAERALDAAVASGDRRAIAEAEQRLRQVRFARESGGSMAKVQHMIGLAKVPHAIARIYSITETVGKLVVAAFHKDVVAALAEPFGKAAVTYTGDHNAAQKQTALDRFVHSPECKLIVGNYSAIGTGVDGLQAVCSNMLVVERDWTPGINSQLQDRLWRIGQTRGVLIEEMVMLGTLDESKARALEEKAERITRLLDARPAERSLLEVAA